jgi:SAM-dependent methyltransferase
MTTAADLASRQDRLIRVLACPTCGGPLSVHEATRYDGMVVDADLRCATHGIVGIIESYDISFRPVDLERSRVARTPGGHVRCPIAADDPRVSEIGAWRHGWEGVSTEGEGPHELVVEFSGVGVSISFYAHDWSGIAELYVDDELVRTETLFRVETELVLVDLVGLRDGAHQLRVRATGESNQHNQGDQVVVSRFDELRLPSDAPLPSLEAVNRGNGFPPPFAELMDALGPDAVAVDCGGGDRRFGDSRVYNLEYLHFELPDIYADGLRLPFRTGTLDAVLSQAVLEHVPDPQQAIDEIRRVLKPDGVLYIEIAFMQPLHAVPSHYFNVTIYGLEYLLRDWDLEESGTFTGLHDTFEWLGRCVSAEQKIGPERLGQALEILAEIDAQTTPEELRPIAGSVWARARRGDYQPSVAEVAASGGDALEVFPTKTLMSEVTLRLRKAGRTPLKHGLRAVASGFGRLRGRAST